MRMQSATPMLLSVAKSAFCRVDGMDTVAWNDCRSDHG